MALVQLSSEVYPVLLDQLHKKRSSRESSSRNIIGNTGKKGVFKINTFKTGKIGLVFNNRDVGFPSVAGLYPF